MPAKPHREDILRAQKEIGKNIPEEMRGFDSEDLAQLKEPEEEMPPERMAQPTDEESGRARGASPRRGRKQD